MSTAVLQHYRAGALRLSALPPLTLYLHLPWCLKKCPYCDFNSHALRDAEGDAGQLHALPEQDYLSALRADWQAALPLVWGRSVRSIFIGGGTPSLFAPDTIAQMIAELRACFKLEPGCEITLEANPGSFERERFRAFRAAGVTRLSVGVQSFSDLHLQALGRVHNSAQARAALDEAASCFEQFNIDLMYALPGQTLAQLQQDLSTALSYAPPHLSVYHLTLEPNTYFATHPPADLPDADSAYAMLDTISAATAAQGLQRYEVSAYAKDGARCRHNLNYWEFGDYLGLGAGAHSKISFAERIVRQVRVRDPKLYMQRAHAGQAVAQEHDIAHNDLAFEYMLNALRLKDGFELAQFSERTGMALTTITAPLQKAERLGLLARDLHRAWPTERGYDLLNDLVELFLPG